MSSNENWRLRIRSKGFKVLAGIPRKDRDRLTQTIKDLPLNPYAGDIEKMVGEAHSWRRRIGAYRIFYEIIPTDKTIYVFRLERRTSKTY